MDPDFALQERRGDSKMMPLSDEEGQVGRGQKTHLVNFTPTRVPSSPDRAAGAEGPCWRTSQSLARY